jgi:hypothetical protein
MSFDCQAFVSQNPTLTRHLIGQLPEQVRYDKRGLLTGQIGEYCGTRSTPVGELSRGYFLYDWSSLSSVEGEHDRSPILCQMCRLLQADFDLAGFNHGAALASLPQHSGRSGRLERSHPPPSACMSNTVFAIRRPRMLTAVTSSVSAALCAVITSR